MFGTSVFTYKDTSDLETERQLQVSFVRENLHAATCWSSMVSTYELNLLI